MPDNHPAYLSPSELGTKDYWEAFYARTLSHLSSKSKPGATPTPAAPDPSDSRPLDSENEDEGEGEEEVDDDTDPGTSWFTEHNAPEKTLSFLTSAEFPLAPCNTLPRQTQTQTRDAKVKVKAQPSILDLGTGNGSMLALLRTKGGFRGEMVGVDYSEKSIVLARELQRLRIHSAYWAGSSSSSSSESGDADISAGAKKGEGKVYADGEAKDGEGEEEDVVVAGASSLAPPNTAEAIPVPGDDGNDARIRFEVWDILAEHQTPDQISQLDWFPRTAGGFDIVLDKGTFDAVSLSDERVGDGATDHRVCDRYPGIARGLVREGGFLVVTSCNWTEEELVKWFTADGGLRVWGRVEYPRFRFGGREGQGVCTVCFQR